MPLPNLFAKRNSQKNTKAKNVPKENSSETEKMSVVTEVNAMLNELVITVSEQTDNAQKNNACRTAPSDVPNFVEQESNVPVVKETDFQGNDQNESFATREQKTVQECAVLDPPNDIPNSTEGETDLVVKVDGSENNQTHTVSISGEETSHDGCTSSAGVTDVPNIEEGNSSVITTSDSTETDQTEDVSTHPKKIARKSVRSSSECGSGIESHAKYVRRKFGSEAEIMSICDKFIPPAHRKELHGAVEMYIDKLIKDSIYKAVRRVNMASLCEDLIGDLTNRKSSQSSESETDFVVEQRLSSNSISELVHLDNAGDDSNERNEERESSLLSDYKSKIIDIDSSEMETEDIDHISFRGYLADLEDTTSVDDLKSIGGDSLNSSLCSGVDTKINVSCSNSKSSENLDKYESNQESKSNANAIDVSRSVTVNAQIFCDLPKEQENTLRPEGDKYKQSVVISANVTESEKILLSEEKNSRNTQNVSEGNLEDEQQNKHPPKSSSGEQEQNISSSEKLFEDKESPPVEDINKVNQKLDSQNDIENVSLIVLSPEEESLLLKSDFKTEENKSADIGEELSQQKISEEERMKVNWKVGNLHVKLPHKTRGKKHLKAWKKRRVAIQPDEFANDPKNQSLVISVYGSDSKKHETTFWHSVSSQKATVFRSSSRTHRYAFTISESGNAIIHLSAENESATQEWMAAVRAVLWPPSPFMELEKMLSGREFEVSIIDNEFSYHAGLLGMYGYLSITPKKLILLHPQQGYVIQEWYLNTVDKFQFVPQSKTEDVHKVLCMTTCRDSSTGQGDVIFFCKEAVTLLQSLASNIHQVLSYHSKQEGGKYQKELEEMAEWLVVPPQDCLDVESSEHYKVPPRQVKSLLDIPNFIFNKSLSPVASAIYPAPNSEVMEPLDASRNKPTNTSQDSGISTCTSGDDFLNCSIASFIIGGGPMTGKSSDSELSDAYTPPRTPEIKKKVVQCEVLKEEQVSPAET